MFTYTNHIEDFKDLDWLCWGQATNILQEIYENDLEEELMEYLSELFAPICQH